MYVYAAKYIVHWGFSVRTPFLSGAQSCYRAPPPTTIVGALACAYYMLHGSKREIVYENGRFLTRTLEFVRKFRVRYAASACTGAAQFQSTIRYFIGFYLARDMCSDLRADRLRVQDLFGPVSFGFCSAPCGRILVVLVSEREIPEEIFQAVTRIGSRESIVTLEEVEIVGPVREEQGKEITEVKVSTPRDLVARVNSGTYVLEQHYVPLSSQDFEDYYMKGVDITKVRQLIVPVLMSIHDSGLGVVLSRDCYVVKTKWGSAILPPEVLV